MAVAGQLSGINAILFYAKYIFMQITSQNEYKSQVYCLMLGLVQTVTTLISGQFLDKFGKRTFMILGQSIILITLFSIFLTYSIDIHA
jgi:MFS family permease